MADLVQIWNSKCSRDEGLTSYAQVNIRSEIEYNTREPKSPWIPFFLFLEKLSSFMS